MVDIAQLVSVPGCGPGGRGFESHYSPHNDNTLLRSCIKFESRYNLSDSNGQKSEQFSEL